MPPEERDAALLLDMLNAARAVATFVAGKRYEEYETDLILRSAVERMIHIIGEAARGVSVILKEAHPEIPWKGIIGQRNVLAHDYGRIVHARIWDIATVHVPELIRKLEPLLPPIPDEPEL